MTQREPVLAQFAQNIGTGQENTSRLKQSLDKCGFCSSTEGLTICKDCGGIAYCSSEHQKFDWKKHKPTCKIIQQKLASTLESNGERHPLHTSNSFPGHQSPAATNYNGVNGFSKSATASPPTNRSNEINYTPSSANCQQEDLSPLTPGGSTGDSAIGSCETTEQGEVIIDTDDPDIQIIETSPQSQSGTPLRSRKRTIQPKTLKDHSLNQTYSITTEEHRQYLMEQGRTLNQHQAAELRLTYIAEHILRSLTEYGWAVVDNFLGAEHCWHIHKEMKVLESRGLFSAGQVADAKNKDEQHLKDIRSDKTYWYETKNTHSTDACTIRMLVTYLDSIVHRFARRLSGAQIQGRSKPMLAIYPSNGSRYVKHVDNPSKDGRRITVIYYCNPGWDYKKDGGVLRLYPETSATPLDIEPRADRLITFWSDHRVPHEVMPVYKDRLAITVWYMDRQERERHQGKVDNKPTTSTDTLCSVSVAPKVKDSKIDTTTLMRRAKLDDATADESDSGKGTSVRSVPISTGRSLLVRSNSQDSAHISDEDEDMRLPRSDTFDPEFNI